MDINIKGNPGTGNTFTEVHIGHVENYNPNATTVTNNYYGTREAKGDRVEKGAEVQDVAPIRTAILEYVQQLVNELSDGWKGKYMKVWEGILGLDVVASTVYHPGGQQGTVFNRKLVANIIHYLSEQGAFRDFNATRLATLLEGDGDKSVRGYLYKNPSNDVASRLNRFMETFTL